LIDLINNSFCCLFKSVIKPIAYCINVSLFAVNPVTESNCTTRLA